MTTFKNVNIVSPAEANDIIVDKAALVLDVRTPMEFMQGHIEGAINLPLDDIDDYTAIENIGPKDRNIVLCCETGTRSAIACGMLTEMGYENIYEIAGGLKEWPFGLEK